MTFRSETWSTTHYLDNKLQVAQRAMEWKMVHISIRYKVSCASIRKQTGVTYIIRLNNLKGDGLATLLEERTTDGQSDCRNGNKEKEKGGKVDTQKKKMER